MLWYSSEAPRGGASDKYLNMFSGRNKKQIHMFG